MRFGIFYIGNWPTERPTIREAAQGSQIINLQKNANLELIDENGAIEENNIVASTVENSTSNSKAKNGVDLNLKSTEKMEEKDDNLGKFQK